MMRACASPGRRERDERGAIAAATAVVMGCLLVIASLVIDVGRDRVVSRDMQAMADVIALDTVRQLDGRPVGEFGNTLTAAKDASLQEQLGSLITVDAGKVAVQPVLANRDTGAWAPATTGQVPNAIRATVSGHSAIRFLPGTAARSDITRSAVAMIGPPIACISAGATFAEVQQQGPLDTLLGKLLLNQGVDRLTVLDPYALATLDMEIPLIDLMAKLQVGTVQELLDLDVSAHDFVIAISEVLPPQHDNKPSPVALLDAIVNGLPDTAGFHPRDILDLDTGGGAGTTLIINTFTLVQAVIMVSNKNHFVELDALKVSVPGLAKIRVYGSVVEAPKIACGPPGTVARSAQIRLKLTAEVKAVSGLVASADIDPLEVNVASGTGEITDVRCTAGSPSVTVKAKTSVGTAKLRVVAKIAGLPVTITAPKTGESSFGTSAEQTYTFAFSGDDLPPGQTFGGFASPNLNSLTPIDVAIVGLDLGGLVQGAVGPLLTLINPLAASAMQQVLSNIGVGVGTVRIQPTARPSCNDPFLIQ